MKRLVLFDIDGTILWGGPLWKDAFIEAVSHYMPGVKFPRVSFGGKTDIQICREMIAAAEPSLLTAEQTMQKIIDRYVTNARREVMTRGHEVTVLPGVKEILQKLQNHPDILLGLLTGNVRAGADVKLGAVGLAHHFRTGVYGDDHWDRYKLPALAASRVQQDFGVTFTGKQIVIIGDTIHDVGCGKSIGARSIAVGTGRGVATEDLLAHNPDYYFADLSATYDVLQAILEEL